MLNSTDKCQDFVHRHIQWIKKHIYELLARVKHSFLSKMGCVQGTVSQSRLVTQMSSLWLHFFPLEQSAKLKNIGLPTSSHARLVVNLTVSKEGQQVIESGWATPAWEEAFINGFLHYRVHNWHNISHQHGKDMVHDPCKCYANFIH